MKVVSWNINGVRAILRKGHWDWIKKQKSVDIWCFQETKAEKEQLPGELINLNGYHSFFASSTFKKGYSGVAIYSKTEPEKVVFGMDKDKFDEQGRVLTCYFKNFVLINVYFPNGGRNKERLDYKLEFFDHFLKYVKSIQKKTGREVIFCGDVNVAHEEIDIARPKENQNNTGFLPEERAWVDEVIQNGFIDVFRHFYPKKKDKYTYWDTITRARERNVGWRIDYFFVSPGLIRKIKGTKIMDNIYGSDHCPISLEIN
jgi:exodeoxyribonuclease-3